MGKQLISRAQLVEATANRLRLIQIDFADESADVRRGYLSEEVARALGEVVPEERAEFLRELMERFPTWDPNVAVAAPEQPAPVQSEADRRELQDPSFLVTRLVEVAAPLGDAERQAIIGLLKEAGLAPRSEGAWPEEAAQHLREGLQLQRDQPLDPVRTVELVALLADFASSLDQLVWRTWAKLAPKSSYRNTTPLRGTVAKFATGDQGTPRGQVVHDLRALRQLIAALVAAVSQSGQFATRYLGRFSPAEIETLVGLQGGSIFVAKEVKCWRKFAELASELNEAEVENEIREAVVEFAESLMRGIRR